MILVGYHNIEMVFNGQYFVRWGDFAPIKLFYNNHNFALLCGFQIP